MSKIAILGAAALCAALTLVGCGSTGGSNSSSENGGSSADVSEALAADLAGTHGEAPSEPVTVESGKNVWLISCAQFAEGCAAPMEAAKDAGTKLGWKMTIFDGQFGAGGAYTNGVRQAIAAKADAIVLMAVDCNLVQAPLKEAKNAGIPVIGVLSFDCDDPEVGGEKLFTTSVQMNDEQATTAEWSKAWGAAKARWLIDATDGTAQIINTIFDGKLTGYYVNDGFNEELKSCSGCEILEDVHVADSDIGSGVLRQKFSAALTANPTANAAHVLYDAWMGPAGLAQAIKSSGRAENISAMGGEGLTPNMGFISEGSGQNAAVAYDEAWLGWGTIDTVARVLAGQDNVGQGIGWQTVDQDNNPVTEKDTPYSVDYDFRAAYEKAWGVK